ncbi:MAG: HDOD domain-containing protein [Gemmatimonadales bacterium]
METRVTEFRAALDALLTSGKQLPTLPTLVLQVQRALANEMSGLRDIGEIIERDPALTARVLRVANSVMFSRGDPITTIGVAVGRLGLGHVRSLCLAVGVVRAFGDSSQRLDHKRYWEHSAAVGMVAERLTDVSKRYAQVDGAEAYTAGLLHDVGLLIVDQFFPEDFAAVQEEMDGDGVARWRTETGRLGLDHGAIAGRVLERWQLPANVKSSVAFHHQPENAPAEAEGLAHMLWAAEALCTASGLELAQEGIAEVSPVEVFDRLEIPADERDRVLGEVGSIGERARIMTH